MEKLATMRRPSSGRLAPILSSESETAEEDSPFHRALTIDQDRLGPRHPDVAVDEIHLALHLRDNGRAAEGLVFAVEAGGSGSISPGLD